MAKGKGRKGTRKAADVKIAGTIEAALAILRKFARFLADLEEKLN